LETAGLRVSHRNFRDFSLFNVDAKSYNCPFATCASTVNDIGSGFDVFIGSSVSRNGLLV
jgi:hypothetical protein